jgi:ABC-type sugar transport system ATPase subunit
MVGRTLGEFYPSRQTQPGEDILVVEAISRKGSFEDVTFSLRRGEILGVFGLVGSGRSQMAKCIFGADPLTSGMIRLSGKAVLFKSPHDAVQAGLALLTEDRKRDGLVMSCSIRDNGSLATMDLISRLGILDVRQRDARVQNKVHELNIQPAQINRLVQQLSGGNQQKVVLAKWLLTEAQVLILDEPTRGVDVATKVEIYHIISDLAEHGVGVLLISSELTEILGMSDRVLVMRHGSLVGEFPRDRASEESLLASCLGAGEGAAGVIQ